MSIKKNFFFNSILICSQYVIPLIVFPYVSRVFGVDKIGLVNYVDSIVNYFILLSTLGLTLTGIRETAKYKNKPNELNKVFSELFLIHLIITCLTLFIYIITIISVDRFRAHQELYFIGASKLFFNVLLIEWLFRGLENFKYITIRSVVIKVIYILLLFIFVKQKDDISLYYLLTCGVIIINGLTNYVYSKQFVSLVFTGLSLKRHIKPLFTIGFYLLLNSMYTTFNVVYLGLVSTNSSVGFYTTSLKLYTLILSLFGALNEVMMPRLSSLIVEKDVIGFQTLINKSINIVSTLSFPIIFSSIILAPTIISFIAGPGYEGSIICFRIIISLVFIIGFAQILANQILMSLQKDKQLVISSLLGACTGIVLNIYLVPRFHEVGTSIVVLISEIFVTISLVFFSQKHSRINIPLKRIFQSFMLSIPYALICILCTHIFQSNITILLFACSICFIYFLLSQLFLIKNVIISTFILKLSYRLQLFIKG